MSKDSILRAAVITVSDRCSKNEATDTSGPAIGALLQKSNIEVVYTVIVPDEKERIKEELIYCADNRGVDLVFTTGGTGFSSRDVTPEATREVIEKETPGISEFIRMAGAGKNKKAVLSRAVSGIRNTILIVNLPGSLKGATESLECIVDIVPHASRMINDHGH